MDGTGKDGAIRHVMSGVNPEGCEVFSFKQPVQKNSITISFGARRAAFPNAAGSASSTALITRKCWSFACIRRFFEARDCPKNCATRRTSGAEVWLHCGPGEAPSPQRHENRQNLSSLSREEQRKRFLARIDEPDKNWKFSTSDIHERKFWKHYMKATKTAFTRQARIMRRGSSSRRR